jgi:nucleoside-diphosphate-sugar epimerase
MQHAARIASLADRPLRHALVLGGSGFIGAPLVRALVASGVRTTCLAHHRPPPSGDARALRGSVERFQWRSIEADLPDVVFHLARIPRRSRLDRFTTRVKNRLANERLLLWLMSCPRPPLFVYVGGTLAYGSHGEAWVTEETPLSPISFSRDYHAAEEPWLRASRFGDAPVILARPAWVMGMGSWLEAYFLRPMRAERAVPLYGDGANWMSLIHVEDCAGFLIHAARRAPLMSVVNVFSGPPLRQVDFVERLSRAARLPVRRIPLDEVEARYGHAVREAFSFSARMGTVQEALHATCARLHLDLDNALEALLEDERSSVRPERVQEMFSRAPERGSVQ